MVAKKESDNKIVVQGLNKENMVIKVKGIDGSSYISHRLTPESVSKFTSREAGKSKKKELRDYDAEYESCFYQTEDGKYGIPAAAFMSAMLQACVDLEVAKTQIKRNVKLLGDIYEIEKSEPKRRVDNPRRSGMNSTPDVRHRPEFYNWECELFIQYNSSNVTPDQIINLINHAGFSIGVGDWRPSAPKSSGSHGMFEVKL